jgi:hypothetical protein
VADADLPRQIDQDIEPPCYDSDDEEEPDDTEVESDGPSGVDEMDVDGNESLPPPDEQDRDDNVIDYGFGDSWDDVFHDASGRANDDETEEAFREREAQGEAIIASLEMYLSNLTLITAAVKDALCCLPGHPYLKNIPAVKDNNFKTMLAWSVQVDADTKARKVPVTWSKNRSRVLLRGS